VVTGISSFFAVVVFRQTFSTFDCYEEEIIYLFLLRRNFVVARNREKTLKFCVNSQVADILAVCLAALQPLTLVQIYQAVAALAVDPSPLSWDEFLGRYQLLAGFLVQRRDESVCLFHPLFREWLIRRGEFFFHHSIFSGHCLGSRDGILGHKFNKRESFAPCYSKSLLMADFRENYSLLWFEKSLQKNPLKTRKLESTVFMSSIL
jgi:hypothetical protein